MKDTSLLKQYSEMKRKHPDAVLLFRVGDFYETFSEDAIAVSEILGITLTRSANGSAKYVELAGFPHHALDAYLPKLVRAGKRVGICEQLKDTRFAQNIADPGYTQLPNGLVIGEKIKMDSMDFNNENERFMIRDGHVGIFIIEPGHNWFFAPLILSPQDVARYKLYTEISWKCSEWVWVDEYGENEELIRYYKELKEMYSTFVSRYGFLNASQNAAFIKLDSEGKHNLRVLERESIDKDGNKIYIPGEAFDEIEERVKEIMSSKTLIDISSLFLLISIVQNTMELLHKLSEIRRMTEEIRVLSHDLKISPQIAFKAYNEEIIKSMQMSLF